MVYEYKMYTYSIAIHMHNFASPGITVAMATLKNFTFFSDTIFSRSLELSGYSAKLHGLDTVV
jgi:hypothetical protein